MGKSSFILASGSPRRRKLLAATGFEFEVVVPAVSEISSLSLTLREATICNATRKGAAVARLHPNKVVLGADTLVEIDGNVIGKPADLDDAFRILRQLSGRAHNVVTAVFISCSVLQRSLSFHEVSQVFFHSLTDPAIRTYLAKVKPLDKAGAYAAQEFGSEVIASVQGSFTNVVGLPMEKTIQALARFGIVPRAS